MKKYSKFKYLSCRWLRRKGAIPAALIEMSKSLHGAERAVHNALEIVL
jgi:hypothetical protein